MYWKSFWFFEEICTAIVVQQNFQILYFFQRIFLFIFIPRDVDGSNKSYFAYILSLNLIFHCHSSLVLLTFNRHLSLIKKSLPSSFLSVGCILDTVVLSVLGWILDTIVATFGWRFTSKSFVCCRVYWGSWQKHPLACSSFLWRFVSGSNN